MQTGQAQARFRKRCDTARQRTLLERYLTSARLAPLPPSRCFMWAPPSEPCAWGGRSLSVAARLSRKCGCPSRDPRTQDPWPRNRPCSQARNAAGGQQGCHGVARSTRARERAEERARGAPPSKNCKSFASPCRTYLSLSFLSVCPSLCAVRRSVYALSLSFAVGSHDCRDFASVCKFALGMQQRLPLPLSSYVSLVFGRIRDVADRSHHRGKKRGLKNRRGGDAEIESPRTRLTLVLLVGVLPVFDGTTCRSSLRGGITAARAGIEPSMGWVLFFEARPGVL